MKKTATFDFGKLAVGYDDWYSTPAGRRHDAAQKKLVRRLMPDAGMGNHLLDAGCGTGHWSVFFARLGFRVAGMDISPEMIEVARARQAENCRFDVADIMHLPFDAGSFDVISAVTVMEFVADTRRACMEMSRCLRPGGCMIIGTLNRLASVNQKRTAAVAEPFTAARMFSLDELQRFLSPFGDVTIGISMENCRARRQRRPSDAQQGVLDAGHEDGALIVARVVKP